MYDYKVYDCLGRLLKMIEATDDAAALQHAKVKMNVFAPMVQRQRTKAELEAEQHYNEAMSRVYSRSKT